MFRLNQGALATKCTIAFLASSLFISSPLTFAQAQTATTSEKEETAAGTETNNSAEASNTASAAKEESAESSTEAAPSSGKSSLTYTAPKEESKPQKIAQADPAATTEPEAKTSEPETAQAAPEDKDAQASPQSIAQAPGGSTAKRLDPAYTRLPIDQGTINIRKQFKLFAREGLIHNLSFRDTPVREVIAELARRGNLNIILDKSVVGNITGDLHDVTLNEAMDSVLASAGLLSRSLDNTAVLVGSPNAMTSLGLNRQQARVFKLSYSSPFEVAALLYTSVFNRGYVPDFATVFNTKSTIARAENPKQATQEKMEKAAAGRSDAREESSNTKESKEESDQGSDFKFATRIDAQRMLKGTTRTQVQEGTGFNNAAQDPGTQQIRAYQDITADFTVDQNAGGAIAIPDARNRQVIVVGTPDDLQLAEECIHLIDRRPKQVHIQVSLVEIQNNGIRRLGATVNLQGQGASGNLLGGAGAPLVNQLPGLGSSGFQTAQTVTQAFTSTLIPPALTSFTRNGTQINSLQNPTTTPAPSTGFGGLLGNFFPAPILPTVAGVAPTANAVSAFNFLTLGKSAGGRANIATVPAGLNLSVNLLLQTDKAKLLANPSVVVSDNTEALVTLATEVIHKVTSTVSLGVTNVNVELTKAGIFLDVLPRISEDGFISMRIRPQVSSPAGPRQTFANEQVIVTLLNVREILAQEIRVKDGQTLALGGLFTEQEVAQINKVPYLAEAPLFGALFRNTLKGRSRTELLLMITPKIVEEQPGSSPLSEGRLPTAM